MSGQPDPSIAIPVPVDGDDDDVAWALQTAQVQWQRDGFADAIVWLRRAVDAAIRAGHTERASELNEIAGQLTEVLLAQSPAAPADAGPGDTLNEEPVELDEVDDLLDDEVPSVRSEMPTSLEVPTGHGQDVSFDTIDESAVESRPPPAAPPPVDLSATVNSAYAPASAKVAPEKVPDVSVRPSAQVFDTLVEPAGPPTEPPPEGSAVDTTPNGAPPPNEAARPPPPRRVPGPPPVPRGAPPPLPPLGGPPPPPPRGPATDSVEPISIQVTSMELEVASEPAAVESSELEPVHSGEIEPVPETTESAEDDRVSGIPEPVSDESELELAEQADADAAEPEPDMAPMELPPEPDATEPEPPARQPEPPASASRASDVAGDDDDDDDLPPILQPSIPDADDIADQARPGEAVQQGAEGAGAGAEEPSIEDASIGGVSLAEVRGFEDLPLEEQAELAGTARVETLATEEEVNSFAAALVTSGSVKLMATIADVATARAGGGDVVFTRGSLDAGVDLRVVAAEDDTRVATWDADQLENAFASCPWVVDELREVADRYQALAGAGMGPLGERLDESLLSMVTSRLELRVLAAGEVLVEAGAEVAFHIIGAGRVEIVNGDTVSEELGPGDFVFSAEVMSHGSAPATARAGSGGALVLFAPRMVAHELLVSVPPLLELLAGG